MCKLAMEKTVNLIVPFLANPLLAVRYLQYINFDSEFFSLQSLAVFFCFLAAALICLASF